MKSIRSQTPFVSVAAIARGNAIALTSIGTYAAKTRAEPKLMRYVCDKGAANSYCK